MQEISCQLLNLDALGAGEEGLQLDEFFIFFSSMCNALKHGVVCAEEHILKHIQCAARALLIFLPKVVHEEQILNQQQ